MKSHPKDHAVFMAVLPVRASGRAIIIDAKAHHLIGVNSQEHADIDTRFRTMAILYVRNTSNFGHCRCRVPAGALRAD